MNTKRRFTWWSAEFLAVLLILILGSGTLLASGGGDDPCLAPTPPDDCKEWCFVGLCPASGTATESYQYDHKTGDLCYYKIWWRYNSGPPEYETGDWTDTGNFTSCDIGEH